MRLTVPVHVLALLALTTYTSMASVSMRRSPDRMRSGSPSAHLAAREYIAAREDGRGLAGKLDAYVWWHSACGDEIDEEKQRCHKVHALCFLCPALRGTVQDLFAGIQ